MIQAILFDLFETLISESDQTPRRASSLGADLGIEPELFREEWKARRQSIILGHLPFPEALAQIVSVAGRPVDRLLLERLCQERIHAKELAMSRIEPEVLAVVGELRSRGIRLGVVSNCFAEDVKAWQACDLSPYFDCALFSFQVHLAKPDPEIFHEAGRRLAVRAEATLYISDGMSDELTAAESTGIRSFQALWFLRRWPNFREESLYTRHLSRIGEILSLV